MVTKNPLHKRLLRELKGDFGKYFVIFALLVGMIGLVSGFLVSDESMILAYDESFEKYNIEDGNFTVQNELNKAQEKRITALGVKISPIYFTDTDFDNDTTIRIFKKRTDIDLECLMDGQFPTSDDEIAIDRMYADNNGISVGDTLTQSESGKIWHITGLVALSDYSALFSDNSDTMFDSLQFGVSVVTDEGFDTLSTDRLTYRYAWKYDEPPVGEIEENERSEDFMEELSEEVTLQDYIPRYQNQAITFTGEDMGSDRAMIAVLLYILIIIIAFVFAVTITNTIQKEANVIGTLRASGYTINELVRHYMLLPLIVTVAGAVIGNVLGYSYFKDMMAALYYASYSLPTYVTVWSAQAFVETTIVPFVIMMIVNFIILRHKLSLSPLKFLRRDLSARKKKRALHLTSRIPFFTRFGLRVVMQNIPNYIVVFIGVLFANLLCLFGFGLPNMLDNYQKSIENNLLCNYQYILDMPVSMMSGNDDKLESTLSGLMFMSRVETENEDAEKFSAYTLKTLGEMGAREEKVMLYGIIQDSRYVKLPPLNRGEVILSAAYAEKFELSEGDTITLKEIYSSDSYIFTVAGVYDYSGAVCVFMDIDDLNDTFDLGKGFFCGYFSNTEITDIDEAYIGSVIDIEALTKVSRQLDTSMGDMATLINGLAAILFIILIYLLSKIIIEKNAQSISMTKILGYGNGEIARLYILSSSVVIVLSLIVTIPIDFGWLKPVFEMVLRSEMTGWIRFDISNEVFIKTFLVGFISYLVVAILEYRKIRKVPMDEALKNVE